MSTSNQSKMDEVRAWLRDERSRPEGVELEETANIDSSVIDLGGESTVSAVVSLGDGTEALVLLAILEDGTTSSN